MKYLTSQGIGKRSAEPEPYYGYYGYYPYRFGGVAGHPTGISYTQRSPQVIILFPILITSIAC